MNNRIKELIEQSYQHDVQNDSTIFLKGKFAELIVRECSAVANHFSDGHELDQFGRKMYHYTVDIGQVINEYFGV